MTNESLLKKIIKKHDLSVMDICDLCKVKRSTVYGWLKDRSSKNKRNMPDRAIELLKLQLGVING